METTAPAATAMLQLGILLGVVLVANAYAVRHLPLESVPGFLRGRVRMANKMRPWLGVAALTLTAVGLFLHVR